LGLFQGRSATAHKQGPGDRLVAPSRTSSLKNRKIFTRIILIRGKGAKARGLPFGPENPMGCQAGAGSELRLRTGRRQAKERPASGGEVVCGDGGCRRPGQAGNPSDRRRRRWWDRGKRLIYARGPEPRMPGKRRCRMSPRWGRETQAGAPLPFCESFAMMPPPRGFGFKSRNFGGFFPAKRLQNFVGTEITMDPA
jgi:hypothetical protein